ncbi:MAG: hypothetical protein KAS97_11905, partial [Candidatus Aminicenantes bacterium]|nr:hypothetical protein [Candidatus Aminicenantes bacterium]
SGKVRILLHDSSDCFDEDSTFFPYNRIRISMYPPEPHSLFGNYIDHIRDVIRHGLNKIFVYNQGSKTLRFFRRYFGINSIFFPTIFIPGWALAGISAYEEINSNTDTRFHSPEFDLILKNVVKDRKLPPLGSLKSKLSNWPGPFSPSIFGTGLVKFLSSNVNRNKIREFVKNYSSHPLPFRFKGLFNLRFMSMSERFMMVFGKDIKNVWKDLELEIGKSDVSPPRILTDTGFVKKFPLYLSDGSVIFFSENFKSYPGVYILRSSEKRASLLFRKKSVKGISYFEDKKLLYFSAVDMFRKYYKFADIYSFDFDKKKVSRITRGGRLTYPVRLMNRIYCIKRDRFGSYLSYFEIGHSKINVISKRFSFLAGLSISPDSGYITASVKTGSGNWKIGVFNLSGALKGLVEHGGERAFSPVWKNNDELMFVTSLEKRFGLASFNVKLGEMKIYNSDKFPSFKYFDVIGGNMIIAPVLTGKGYDLMKIDLGKMEPEVKAYSFSGMKEEGASEVISDTIESRYKSLRDFSPKYFTLTFREGGNELQAGIMASGFDSLHHHFYKVMYLAGLTSGRSNYYFNYTFNGFPGELDLKFTKFSDLNISDEKGEFFHDTEKFTASYSFPLIKTIDSDLSFYTDIHFEKGVDEFQDTLEDINTIHNGIRAGITINSTDVYYNSISENNGFNFSAVYSKEMELFGSRFNSNVFTLEYSQFISFPQLNTLAMRLAFAESWGEGRRMFYMGGISAGDEQSYSGEKLFGLVRGYPSGYFSGTTGFSLNFEYRFLLKKIERSFLIFKSIESLYASLFFDSGQVWRERMEFDPVISGGGELNLV